MKSYVIHFIRHGAIDETLSGKYIGTTDVSLSDKGKAALRRTAIPARRSFLQVRSNAAPKPALCCIRSSLRWLLPT